MESIQIYESINDVKHAQEVRYSLSNIQHKVIFDIGDESLPLSLSIITHDKQIATHVPPALDSPKEERISLDDTTACATSYIVPYIAPTITSHPSERGMEQECGQEQAPVSFLPPSLLTSLPHVISSEDITTPSTASTATSTINFFSVSGTNSIMERDTTEEGYEKEPTSDLYIPLLLLLSQRQLLNLSSSDKETNPPLEKAKSSEPIHERCAETKIALELYNHGQIKFQKREYEEARSFFAEAILMTAQPKNEETN
eukprot:11636858-Ditylum_brightwellii.AAC.1